MKVIMLAVMSTNGKITDGSDPDIYKWTSPEDQDFFFGKIRDSKLIVIGSKTYDAMKDRLRKDAGRLRIVVTKNPGKYAAEQIDGVLEFRSDTPAKLVESLSTYDEMILAGGSAIYTSFAKEGLIDEIYLTIEPKVFGDGKPLFADDNFKLNLKLASTEKLNDNGTILLKYIVEK